MKKRAKKRPQFTVEERLARLEGNFAGAVVNISELESDTDERFKQLNLHAKELELQLSHLEAAVAEGSGEPYTWEQKDGTKILPMLMDEGHLRNAISWCVRRLLDRLSHGVYVEESERWVTGLSHFLHEAKRRGLRV